jgi:hypothetical protein
MSITTYAKVLPRTATTAYLRVLRLPLTAAERAAGDRIDNAWKPSVAFEAFEAGVERTVGSLLRDEHLLKSARLRREKVAKLRKATALMTVAQEQRADAGASFATRRESAEEQRAEAAHRASQKEAALQRNTEVEKQKVQQKAATSTAAARRTKAKQDEAIDRRERVAKVESLDAESKALRNAREAVDAQQDLKVVADTLEGAKEDRKTS